MSMSVEHADTKHYNVGILGCTGTVGQRFVQLLIGHPWFNISALGASERSAGKPYSEAMSWRQTSMLPPYIGQMIVSACTPDDSSFSKCDLVFSALDADIAGPVEHAFASHGIAVFSNAKNNRMVIDVPLLVPAANADHIHCIPKQIERCRWPSGGFIVTNANCASTGLVIVLRPLMDAFGIDAMMVFTMQAISGAGYPGVASLDITDNVIPYISGEESKVETEANKILGNLNNTRDSFDYAQIRISSHCNRVPVIDGHTECVSLKFTKTGVSVADVEKCLTQFVSRTRSLGFTLPSEPEQVLRVFGVDEPTRPQPRLDRDLCGGYGVSVGRIRDCPVFDIKLTLLSHNVIIGAAGGSILNAELSIAAGYIQNKNK